MDLVRGWESPVRTKFTNVLWNVLEWKAGRMTLKSHYDHDCHTSESGISSAWSEVVLSAQGLCLCYPLHLKGNCFIFWGSSRVLKVFWSLRKLKEMTRGGESRCFLPLSPIHKTFHDIYSIYKYSCFPLQFDSSMWEPEDCLLKHVLPWCLSPKRFHPWTCIN